MARSYIQITTADKICLKNIRKDVNEWIQFLKNTSSYYHLPFDKQLSLYAGGADAKEYKSEIEWRKGGRRLVPGSKGISVLDDDQVIILYGDYETSDEKGNLFSDWKYNNDNISLYIDSLKSSYSVDGTSFNNVITEVIRQEYKNIRFAEDGEIPELCRKICNNEEDLKNFDTFFFNSTVLYVASRLNIGVNFKDIDEALKEGLSLFVIRDYLAVAGRYITQIGSDMLRIIEKTEIEIEMSGKTLYNEGTMIIGGESNEIDDYIADSRQSAPDSRRVSEDIGSSTFDGRDSRGERSDLPLSLQSESTRTDEGNDTFGGSPEDPGDNYAGPQESSNGESEGLSDSSNLSEDIASVADNGSGTKSSEVQSDGEQAERVHGVLSETEETDEGNDSSGSVVAGSDSEGSTIYDSSGSKGIGDTELEGISEPVEDGLSESGRGVEDDSDAAGGETGTGTDISGVNEYGGTGGGSIHSDVSGEISELGRVRVIHDDRGGMRGDDEGREPIGSGDRASEATGSGSEVTSGDVQTAGDRGSGSIQQNTQNYSRRDRRRGIIESAESDEKGTEEESVPYSLSESWNRFLKRCEENDASHVEQTLIDRGTGFTDGKYRLFDFFSDSSHTAKERVDYLKQAFGIGGTADSIIDIWHDGKGYTVSFKIINEKHDLKWSEISSIISNLIDNDKYLTKEEKEHLPRYRIRQKNQAIRDNAIVKLKEVLDKYNDERDDTEKIAAYPLHEAYIYAQNLDFRSNIDPFSVTEDAKLLLVMHEYIAKIVANAPEYAVELHDVISVIPSADEIAAVDITNDESNVKALIPVLRYNINDKVVYEGRNYIINGFDDNNNVILADYDAPLFTDIISVSDFEKYLLENPTQNSNVVIYEEISEEDLDEDKNYEVPSVYTSEDVQIGDNVTLPAQTLAEHDFNSTTYSSENAVVTRIENGYIDFRTDDDTLISMSVQEFDSTGVILNKHGEPDFEINYSEEELALLNIDSKQLASEFVKSFLAWDEIEQLGDYFYDNDNRIPEQSRDKAIFGKGLSENDLYSLSEILKNGFTDDYIGKEEELAFNINLCNGICGSKGQYLPREYNTSEHSLTEIDYETSEQGYVFTLGNAQRLMTFELVANALLSLVYSEYRKNHEIDMKKEETEEIPLPNITCIWSESSIFEAGKTYSLYEFDELMRMADTERNEGKQRGYELYGKYVENWPQDAEEYKYIGYDKTRYTINLPDGTSFSVRQDIGDGFGGVIEFLEKTGEVDESVISILKESIAKNHPESEALITREEPEENIELPKVPFSVGDKISCNGRIYTVKELQGLYPNQFTVGYKERDSKGNEYEVTQNIDISVLEQGEKITVEQIEENYISSLPSLEDKSGLTNFNLRNHPIPVDTPLNRVHRNMDAIRTVKAIQSENRAATFEEQIIMSQYVGWGGLSEFFDTSSYYWERNFRINFDELKNKLLTKEEFDSARASVTTAFYTPQFVVEAIYQCLERLGFDGGKVLEPSCATGNFIGEMPLSMVEKSIVTGVELDTISGLIARSLYPRSNIYINGFEKVKMPDDYFDVAIGNVPFGDFELYDKELSNEGVKFKIHDYFFAKALRKVHPGGIVAFITSSGTMDKKDSSVRKYIADRAELLGAIRLPNTTFKGNAGTKVTSDIVFLKKRDRVIDASDEWIGRTLIDKENDIEVNTYFANHPEMILGKMVKTTHFNMNACEAIEGENLESRLIIAVKNIKGEFEKSVSKTIESELTITGIETDIGEGAAKEIPNWSYGFVNNILYYRKNNTMNKVPEKEVKKTHYDRLKALIEVRKALKKVIDVQTQGCSDSVLEEAQNILRVAYDAFNNKYGRTRQSIQKYFSDDASFSIVNSLEIVNGKGEFVELSPIFTNRTIGAPPREITSVTNAHDALVVSIGKYARVDMDFMQRIYGKSEEEIYSELKGDIFLNHEETGDKYVMNDEYLSGNIRRKLAAVKKLAETDSAYQFNVERLESVMPRDLTAEEITMNLGATWIPVEYIERFIQDVLNVHDSYGTKATSVVYSEGTAEYSINGKSGFLPYEVRVVYGTDRMNALVLLERILNQRKIQVFDTLDDKKKVLNTTETLAANDKAEAIKNAWTNFLREQSKISEDLCRIYNERFNSVRPREYDGSNIVFHGMNPLIQLRQYQKDAIARALYGGNTLLAHVVGAGKSYEMAAISQESKMLGLSNKSLFVVPNYLTQQMADEYRTLYPAANLLVTTDKDFKPDKRREFIGRIAAGDYDAIIMGHSQFTMIPMSAKFQTEFISREIARLESFLEDENIKSATQWKDHGSRHKNTVKLIEKRKKSLQTRLEKISDSIKRDEGLMLTFEDLGIDKLFVDESHLFKNLAFETKMNNIAGISNSDANRSEDLYMKCRYLDEKTGNKAIVFATGTPVSNSMVELYTLQRYLGNSRLQEAGLAYFDQWASTFGETVQSMELKPEGNGYQTKTRFSKFNNLPELHSMFKEFADVKTRENLPDLITPNVEYITISTEPTEHQQVIIQSLGERADACRSGNVDPRLDNMLKITSDGKKVALDQRLFDEQLLDDLNSKINSCVNNVFDIWQDTADQRLTQLIFCDLSSPKKDKFNVYDDVKQKLIAKGVPENEIKFIHDAKTDKAKQDLFAEVREGKVRILMGSTSKMGAGTNVQTLLIASHDLDCPWRPADLEQRAGRIVRFGNRNESVKIFRYITSDTFDAYSYQILENKQKFISQIMTSDSPAVRTTNDCDTQTLTYAEIKMLATGDPRIKERMELENEITRITMKRSWWLSDISRKRTQVNVELPLFIDSAKKTIADYDKDLELARKTASNSENEEDKKFIGIILNEKHYDDRVSAGKAFMKLIYALKPANPIKIGNYRGFDIAIKYSPNNNGFDANIIGSHTYIVNLGDSGEGNIRRIHNEIEQIGKKREHLINRLHEKEKDLESLSVEIAKPFAQEEELTEMKATLARLDEELGISDDQKRNEIGDDEIKDEPGGSSGAGGTR